MFNYILQYFYKFEHEHLLLYYNIVKSYVNTKNAERIGIMLHWLTKKRKSVRLMPIEEIKERSNYGKI